MTEDKRTESKINWFLVIPSLGSLIWLISITIFVYWKFHSIDDFLKQDFNALGDFLAGAFAPLATFWLVYAVVIQSRQLKMQSLDLQLQHEEIAEAVKQAKEQAASLKKNTEQFARDAFYRLLDYRERELNFYISKFLLNSPTMSGVKGHILTVNGDFKSEEELWNIYSNGKKEVFQEIFNEFYKEKPQYLHLDVIRNYENTKTVDIIICIYEEILEITNSLPEPNKIYKEYIENLMIGTIYGYLVATREDYPWKFKIRDTEVFEQYRRDVLGEN